MIKKITEDYLDEQLDHWARWLLQGLYNELGYPTQNALYELLKYGHVMKRDYQKHTIGYDKEAEEIETHIVELNRWDKKLASALRIQYLSRGSIREKAAKMKMGITQFKVYVKLGKQWLAGRLSNNRY